MFNTLKRLLCFLIKLHDMTMACYSHLQCEELADVACLRHAEYPHWMCLSPTLVWGKKDSVSSTHEKSLPKLSRLLRYLADSNRRPRFCRPIPNHSGKVPFCGCKDTTFWRTAIYFQSFFSNQPSCRQFQPVPHYQGYEKHTTVYIEEFQVFTTQMGHCVCSQND